ncbi:MAG: VIT1/CCC1 transporter family protein [Candidatus Azambacteria bacterium]|nr:VIT1/CCC1 transporter family protein [Candidatus Azambacteria bacterium]
MFERYSKNVLAEYLRAFVFGVEDSLASTVGLLSGIAIAGVARETILLTGAILILVEAFSMAMGDFLSEYSSESYMRQAEVSSRRSFIAAIIMFFSYFLAGLIPLFPYLVLVPGSAVWLSIILSLLALFSLGIIGAKISNINTLKSGLKMFLVGGAAIFVGVFIGIFFGKK